SRATELGRHAVQEAAEFAGARKPVHLIEEPVAAAIGTGMPIGSPLGNRSIDVGGGTTEVAVLSLGGVVASASVRIAGNHFDQAIMAFCRKEYGLGIGQGTAEYVKSRYVCAWPLRKEGCVDIRGVDQATGSPKTITVSTVELREAIEEQVSGICDAVRDTLEATPPELVADASNQGLVLTGGGALLLALDRRLAYELGFPVRLARPPSGHHGTGGRRSSGDRRRCRHPQRRRSHQRQRARFCFRTERRCDRQGIGQRRRHRRERSGDRGRRRPRRWRRHLPREGANLAWSNRRRR